MVDVEKAIALINLIFSIGISVMMFCRMYRMPQDTPIRKITPYALVLTGGLASALQPLMGYWPTPHQVFFAVAFFFYIASARPVVR